MNEDKAKILAALIVFPPFFAVLGVMMHFSNKYTLEKSNETMAMIETGPGVYYSPHMIAWQAAQNDIAIAVPLYPTPHADKYMRIDKKIISAPAAPSPEGT